MMQRRRIATISGTEIYLHPAAVLYAAYLLLLRQGNVLWVSLISILVHEGAHALVSSCCGHPPREIELSPLGAMIRLEDEAALPVLKRLVMLLAGPAASFLMCRIAIWLTARQLIDPYWGRLIFCCNALLLVGNLLPALPMDGGRILSLLLSLRLRGERVWQVMRVIGTCIGLGFILLNLVLSARNGAWNLSLAMAGCFLMYAAATCTTTAAMAELRLFMDRKIRLECKGMLNCRWLAVTDQLTLRKAVKRLAPDAYTMFACIDPLTGRCACTVSESEVIAAYLCNAGGRLGDRMSD